MATEVRLLLDEDGPTTDPRFIHRAITEGRILRVRQVPDACPRCHYSPEHTSWCPERDAPLTDPATQQKEEREA